LCLTADSGSETTASKKQCEGDDIEEKI